MGESYCWSMEESLKLIEMYQEKRLLWDVNSRDYSSSSSTKKRKAWQQIARYFGVERSAVEMRVNVMVSKYCREVRLSEGESKWYAFSWMRFLDREEDEHKEEAPESLAETTASPVAEEAEGTRPEGPGAICCAQRTLGDTCHGNSRPRDDVAIYGDYVASKLRNMSTNARNTTQYLINTIMYNAELGQYDHVDGHRVRIISDQHGPPQSNPRRKRAQDPLSQKLDDSKDMANGNIWI